MNVFSHLLKVLVLIFSILAVFSTADLSIDGESLVLSINEEGPIKVRRARETGEH
ncbi:Protein CBG08666 [Caenorhabditis briggsae]|uniref:Protein CBG08666 n=1 Tax=Caenorhabditis briggsae TaxID=6238 RepID=A8X6V2_CAEBR|nr:Protein CBG08666 [Caenorhabditis briggsae]CAP28363.1 Protein CBG08666 [Caenorhabditis briggsae]